MRQLLTSSLLYQRNDSVGIHLGVSNLHHGDGTGDADESNFFFFHIK